MDEGGEVVLERVVGDTRGGGEWGSERGAEGGGGEGDMHVEVQRGEANVSSPLDQSMLGLWRCSHGNPSTSWKWPSLVTWKVSASV